MTPSMIIQTACGPADVHRVFPSRGDNRLRSFGHPLIMLVLLIGLTGCPQAQQRPGDPVGGPNSGASAPSGSSQPAGTPPAHGTSAGPVAVSTPLSPERSLELSEQAATGLAILENSELGAGGDPQQAYQLFAKIGTEFPTDPFVVRNQAIAALLALTRARPEAGGTLATSPQAAQAQAAVERLQQLEPKSPVSAWLAARVRLATQSEGHLEAAWDSLARSREISPKFLPAAYEQYQLAQQPGATAELKVRARAALGQAYQIDGDNLFLLTELLPQLAQAEAAAAKEPAAGPREFADIQTIEVLGSLSRLIAPYAATIRGHGFDVAETLSKAQELVLAGDWAKVTRLTNQIRNVLRVEAIVRSDLRRLQPNPLEFVVTELSAASRARLTLAPADAAPVTALDWASLDLPGGPAEQLVIADFNLDERPDLALLSDRTLRLSWQPEGWRSARSATDKPGEWVQQIVDLPAAMTGLVTADLDDDAHEAPKLPPTPEGKPLIRCEEADADLVLWGPAGVMPVENRRDPATGGRSFMPRTDAIPSWSQGAVQRVLLADLDHDGDLDLVIVGEQGLAFWSNRGNWGWDDISDRSDLSNLGGVTAIAPCDWDDDLDLDLIVALPGQKDSSPRLGALENLRYGRFRWREWSSPANWPAVVSQHPIRSLVPLDVDGDLRWDLVVAGDGGAIMVRRAPGNPFAPDWQPELQTLASQPVAAIACDDLDNDGLIDAAILLDPAAVGPAAAAASNPPQSDQDSEAQEFAWRIVQRLGIAATSADHAIGPRTAFGSSSPRRAAVAIADLDRDGSLELLWSQTSASGSGSSNDQAQSSIVAATRTGQRDTAREHWLDVRLRAQQVKESSPTASGRVNHLGLGSVIELKAGGRFQRRLVTAPITHFGLGDRPKIDVARVIWTNGIPQNFLQQSADQLVCERQELGGSCPYLYTWDGEKFAFWTDCLWAAPIGLKFGETVIAPWREWEYLKIDGRQLRPKDGEYVLQLTEELWEATYLDQVQLIAVDHPADVEIFTNEKVGPGDLATPHIYTVSTPRRPKSAIDPRGNDLLPLLRQRDELYTQTFSVKHKQGLTDEHWIELDLGDFGASSAPTKQATAESEQQRVPEPEVHLFLHGWVYPTDVNLNVQLSQNPHLGGPRPPSIWVPDKTGEWQCVRPYAGFPGGKPKTIVLNLTGLFAGSDHRVRIVSNLELYWDQAFFTVNEPRRDLIERRLNLAAADLHYRGFSSVRPRGPSQPDKFDYDSVDASPKWPPMHGDLTGYGDVAELVQEQDDRLAIFGAGDEVTLRFRVPEETPPSGWVRDFVLYNVGWDKDANLNTVYGDVVEPQPFTSMRFYGDEPVAHSSRDSESAKPADARQSPVRKQPIATWKRLIKDWAASRSAN